MKTIVFFNNKGGVGKTSLVYHLAWMYADLGLNVITADLDPQANLTIMFLDEDQLEALWEANGHESTVLGAVRPLLKGTGDVTRMAPEVVGDNVALLPGDLGLSVFEDELSRGWTDCADGNERGFRIMSAFHRVLKMAAEKYEADLVLIDVGPNLGAINRAAIIAGEHLVIPLAADLFSLQGLRNLGPTLRQWRERWGERLAKNPDPDLSLPGADMAPAGYVLMQHGVRLDRPVKAYARWMARIPGLYREAVLGEPADEQMSIDQDPHALPRLKHYRSLMPMAMEARKPMFSLRPADGAIGAQMGAVQAAYQDFRRIALELAGRVELDIPPRYREVSS